MLFLFYVIPLIVYVSLLNSHSYNFEDPHLKTLWRSFPLLRINEFFFGVVLYYLKNKVNLGKPTRSFLFWSALILSILFAMDIVSVPHSIIHHLLLVPLFGLIILLSSLGPLLGQGLFTNSLSMKLGAASYALYITHQPLGGYIIPYVNRSILSGLLYFSCVTILSLALYRFFEIPIQKRIRKRLGS